MPRRRMLAAGAAFLFSGCGEVPVLSNAAEAIRIAAVGQPDPPLKRAAIAKLPYATIAAKVGKGARGVLVLGRYDGEDRHWISGNRSVIVTRRGRVVKTVGFPENLKDTRASDEDPLAADLHRLEGKADFLRYVDFDGERRYGVPIHSTFEVIGEKRITIAEVEFDTVLVRESNQAKTIGWRFENLYWVDAIDGFVWKSRQHIAKSLPSVVIEVLKPAV